MTNLKTSRGAGAAVRGASRRTERDLRASRLTGSPLHRATRTAGASAAAARPWLLETARP